MSLLRPQQRHGDQVFLACCLSVVGLSVAVLRALRDPGSRVSRFVDRNILPDGVSL